MFWKEKERSRVRAVQMDGLRGLLGIRRMDRILFLCIELDNAMEREGEI